MVEEKYDGVSIKKSGEEGGEIHARFDITEALDQENPRNVFLNGQLHLELTCDDVISAYIADRDPVRMGVMNRFLTSRDITFFGKIELMKRFVIKDEKGNQIKMIRPNVIKSLKSIGEVRNAFQHNLVLDIAIRKLKQTESKFHLTGIKLKECLDLNAFLDGFKREVIEINDYFHDIRLKHKFNDLTLE